MEYIKRYRNRHQNGYKSFKLRDWKITSLLSSKIESYKWKIQTMDMAPQVPFSNVPVIKVSSEINNWTNNRVNIQLTTPSLFWKSFVCISFEVKKPFLYLLNIQTYYPVFFFISVFHSVFLIYEVKNIFSLLKPNCLN